VNAHLFDELLERLMYLGSVEQVHRAVQSIPRLDAAELRHAIDRRVEQLAQEGPDEERELVEFVRSALQDVLVSDPVPDQSEVRTLEDLQRVAVGLTALRIRTLLRQHREMLTEENATELSLSATEPDLAPEERYRRVILLYVAARVTGGSEQRVKACMIAGAFWRQQKHFERAQRLLDRSLRVVNQDDRSSRIMILAAQVGLCRAKGDLEQAIQILKQCLELAVATMICL
jgi:hypothetical protein